MKMNKENLIFQMLQAIGENPLREGLLGTPERVVRMWDEIFRGYDKSKHPKITTFSNGADGIQYDQMIFDKGDFYSHCEHHILPFFGKYTFAYIPSPNGKILGLSKVARIVDYHSAKLQLQERLTADIVNDLWNALGYVDEEKENNPLGMGLVMQGEHLCKTMRGARKKGVMTTTYLKGIFQEPSVKSEFLNSLKI